MNPIELGKAIAEVGIPVITAVMLILVVGLVWYLIKRQTKREDKHDVIQKDERDFYRKLVTNDLKSLHNDSVKNANLNKKNITLQKSIAKKTIGALDIICDRLNGGNSKMIIAKKELKR